MLEANKNEWEPKITSSLARLEIEYLVELLNGLSRHHKHQVTNLEEIANNLRLEKFASENDYKSYLGALHDKPSEFPEIRELAEHLAIVGLYRIVELGTKRILRSRYDKRIIRTLHIWDVLKTKLKEDFRIELERVKCYATVDEIRLLNNAIKHSGYVDSRLANYSDWVENDELKNLGVVFDRIKGDVSIYLVDLNKKILANEST